MEEPEQLAGIFRALSVETRVRIVQALNEHPLCVGVLSSRVGITPGAASQHLRILRDAGLVKADRRGYFVHYRVVPGAAERVKYVLESLFGKPRHVAESISGLEDRPWVGIEKNAGSEKYRK